MKRAITVLAIGALGAILGSAGPAQAEKGDQPEVDPSITDGTAAKEFKEARAKWLGSGVGGYRMKIGRYCFCPPPSSAKITVRPGEKPKSSVRKWTGPRSVPAMFKIIHDAIKGEVAILDVEYDRKYGFAKMTSIDYIAMAVDDEMSYSIKGFKPTHRAMFS